jgi:hypothetical protein
MASTTSSKAAAPWQWSLWRQWVLANALGETVGLGATLLAGAFVLVQEKPSIGAIPAVVLGVLAGTLIEGTVVGTSQRLVLRRPLPKMRWGIWAGATAAGACVAWTLGMIPSTLATSGPDSGAAAQPVQMSDLVVYGLAGSLGLVAGSILGMPQWLALRQHLPRAGWWVPANALAWAVGMAVIFIGTSFIPATGITGPIALLLLLFVAAAGALVGAVHGLFLVWMVQQRQVVKGLATKTQLARV